MSTGTPGAPATITVDTVNETVTLEFVDDQGNATPAPPGATVTFAVSDPSVATVHNNDVNPFQGDIAPLGVGTVQVSAVVSGATDASGNPLPNPDPETLNVDPGAPAGERLSLGTAPDTSGGGGTPPAPTPPAAATPTQPVYTFSGAGNPDPTVWPASGFETSDTPPLPLYYYVNDTANSGQTGPANGNGLENGSWTVYTGAVQQVGA